MRITEKEIESIAKLAPFERYSYLIKRVADFEVLYALRSGDEWAMADIDGNKMFSIWSSKEFALLNAINIWDGYEAVEIDLEAFEHEIISLVKHNGYLLNVFSMAGRSGFIVELEEFIRDLNDELGKYA